MKKIDNIFGKGLFMNKQTRLLAGLLGFTSIVGQVIVLREFSTAFYGNEMAYAVVLASWLFWIAAGSFTFSQLIGKIREPRQWTEILFKSIAAVLPLTIVAIRCGRMLFGIRTGEIVGVEMMVAAAFIFLGPLTFILGGLFTLLCGLSGEGKGGDVVDVNRVYFWESLGATLGGVVLSFVLLSVVPVLPLVFVVGAMNAVAASSFHQDRARRRIEIIALTFFLGFLGVAGVGKIDAWTRSVQWQGMAVKKVGDSIYGNLAVVQLKEATSLFENGLLAFSTENRQAGEEKVHFSMLAHPAPRRVLFIGHAGDGALREILKYPVARVDVVQLDPQSLAWVNPFLPAEALAALDDSRVAVHFTDGRRLVKNTDDRYDVIIVALGDPYNAQINRYYTKEFFHEARRVLAPAGVLSFAVSSSENYLSEAARDYLRALHSTLKAVFPDVQSIPGETHIFLAGLKQNTISVDPQFFINEIKKRAIMTQYVSAYYLPYQLSADRLSYINEALRAPGQVNTDMHPIVYFYDATFWATHFDAGFKTLLKKLQGLKFWHLLLFPLLLAGVGWTRKRDTVFPFVASVATTGLSEIVFQVIVILAFQTLYGYAYYQIAWIMTAFMAGLVIGSWCARRVLEKPLFALKKIYCAIQAGMGIYSLLLPVLFAIFRDWSSGAGGQGFFAGVFTALPIVAGALGGLQYPLAVALINRAGKKQRGVAEGAGKLYAADVLGATIGALLTGTILIPIVGITAVAGLMAALNAAAWLLLIRQPAKESPGL